MNLLKERASEFHSALFGSHLQRQGNSFLPMCPHTDTQPPAQTQTIPHEILKYVIITSLKETGLLLTWSEPLSF